MTKRVFKTDCERVTNKAHIFSACPLSESKEVRWKHVCRNKPLKRKWNVLDAELVAEGEKRTFRVYLAEFGLEHWHASESLEGLHELLLNTEARRK